MKLWTKFVDWLCGVSSDTKGAGLGRGTNRGSNLEWWKTLSKLKPAVVLVALATPAQASYEFDSFSINTSRPGMGQQPNRSWEGGGGYMSPMQRYRAQQEAISRGASPPDGADSFADQFGRAWDDFTNSFGGWGGGSDNLSSDGNGAGATGLAGGGCCSSDDLSN